MYTTRMLFILLPILLLPSLASAEDPRIETARNALAEHLRQDQCQVFHLKAISPGREEKLTPYRALIMTAADIRGYKGGTDLDKWVYTNFLYRLSDPQPKGLKPGKVRSHWQAVKQAKRFHTFPNCKQMKFFVTGEADFSKIPEKNVESQGCVTRINVAQGKLDGEKRQGLYNVPFIAVTYNSRLRLSGRGLLYRYDVVLDASGKVALILETQLKMLWKS